MFAQTSSNFPLWLSFGSCLGEFAWCGFPLISIFIYYVRNHLFHLILTMACRLVRIVETTNKPFFEIKRLISQFSRSNSYLLPYALCCEVGLDHYSYLPPRDISIYSLSWQVILVFVVDCVYHLRIGSCVKFVLFICLLCLLQGS